MTASDFVQALLSAEGPELLYSMCVEPEIMDLYFTLAPIREQSFRGINRRVKEEDVSGVRMVYVDLDVKDGSFSSQKDALEFLASLKNYPNVVVSSGSGGLHAYWRLEGFSGPHGASINTLVGKDVMTRWWAYLSEIADGRKIDKLVDVTRMSRLPGTIRWPKEGTNEIPAPVTLLYSNREPVLKVNEVLTITEDAWKNLVAQRKKAKARDTRLDNKVSKVVEKKIEGKWGRLLAIASVQDWVNEHVEWSAILHLADWNYLRTDNQGREEWARPNQSGKSATVNWPDSPHVMSLLSTSYDTGMSDLLDAGIALTKWRVLLRLCFNDDIDTAVNWTLEEMMKNGIQ